MFVVAFWRLSALIWNMAQHFVSLFHRAIPMALVATIAISACSSSGNDADGSTTTTGRSGSSVAASTGSSSTSGPTATVATSTTAQGSSELRSAVRAFWDLYLELGTRTGPFDAEAIRQRLAERTTGAELNRLLAYFSSNAASGYVVLGTIDIAPTIVSVSADSAQVRDCYDDTTGLYRVSDNSRVDSDSPLRHQVLMTFLREGGVWKVAAVNDEGDGCTG